MRKWLLAFVLCGMLLGSGCMLGDWAFGTAPQEIVQPADAPPPKGAIRIGITQDGKVVYYFPGRKGVLVEAGGALAAVGGPWGATAAGLLTLAGSLYAGWKRGHAVGTTQGGNLTEEVMNTVGTKEDKLNVIYSHANKGNKAAKKAINKLVPSGKK